MNAFLAAVVASIVIGVGAFYALDALELSSAAATASDSVRLN